MITIHSVPLLIMNMEHLAVMKASKGRAHRCIGVPVVGECSKQVTPPNVNSRPIYQTAKYRASGLKQITNMSRSRPMFPESYSVFQQTHPYRFKKRLIGCIVDHSI